MTVNFSSDYLYTTVKNFFRTVVILLFTTAAAFGISRVLVDKYHVAVIYIVGVVIVSIVTNGYFFGFLASLISIIAVDFIFTYPHFEFSGYALTFFCMISASVVTSALINKIKRETHIANNRERQTHLLYEISKKLLLANSMEDVVALSAKCLHEVFDSDIAFYMKDPYESEPYTIIGEESSQNIFAEEIETAHIAFVRGKKTGNGTDTCSASRIFFIPILFQSQKLGMIGMHCDFLKLAKEENKILLNMIVAQIALAVSRQKLSDEQNKIMLDAEREKMRSNLLRAISHDLRTPLTGILGASSVLLENGSFIDKEEHDKLVYDIKESSQWLINMVENLLSVTRIKEDKLSVNASPEAIEEIIAEAVTRIKCQYKTQRINVKVPDELVILPVDAILIKQVIINLVENAIKHGMSTEVDIVVEKSDKEVAIYVRDNGKGISNEDLPYLFDGYISKHKDNVDSTRGMGIGLSICKSIIKAHSGNIIGYNDKSGGAVFKITLPFAGDVDNE
ncbi:MAG: ATP-binding protein [Clostridia bacterium]|nr:ATP-binding protein [Clostridia bacterium]